MIVKCIKDIGTKFGKNRYIGIVVKEGSIVQAYDNYYCNENDFSEEGKYIRNMSKEKVWNKGDEDFERMVKQIITMMYDAEYGSFATYVELVNYLNPQMIKKYFIPFYVPKKLNSFLEFDGHHVVRVI